MENPGRWNVRMASKKQPMKPHVKIANGNQKNLAVSTRPL